jgi:hypothetical protein
MDRAHRQIVRKSNLADQGKENDLRDARRYIRLRRLHGEFGRGKNLFRQ